MTTPLFDATLAATGIDYPQIVSRPKWDQAEAEARLKREATRKANSGGSVRQMSKQRASQPRTTKKKAT